MPLSGGGRGRGAAVLRHRALHGQGGVGGGPWSADEGSAPALHVPRPPRLHHHVHLREGAAPMPYTFMCLRSCFSLLSAFCVALFVRSIANVCNRCIRCIRRLANVLPTALLPLVARECMDDQPGVGAGRQDDASAQGPQLVQVKPKRCACPTARDSCPHSRHGHVMHRRQCAQTSVAHRRQCVHRPLSMGPAQRALCHGAGPYM